MNSVGRTRLFARVAGRVAVSVSGVLAASGCSSGGSGGSSSSSTTSSTSSSTHTSTSTTHTSSSTLPDKAVLCKATFSGPVKETDGCTGYLNAANGSVGESLAFSGPDAPMGGVITSIAFGLEVTGSFVPGKTYTLADFQHAGTNIQAKALQNFQVLEWGCAAAGAGKDGDASAACESLSVTITNVDAENPGQGAYFGGSTPATSMLTSTHGTLDVTIPASGTSKGASLVAHVVF